MRDSVPKFRLLSSSKYRVTRSGTMSLRDLENARVDAVKVCQNGITWKVSCSRNLPIHW